MAYQRFYGNGERIMFVDQTFLVGLQDAGPDGTVCNRALIEAFSNVASLHARRIGQGADDMPVTHLAWVVTNWYLEVYRRIRTCKTFTARTWARGYDRLYAYRDCLAADENGDILARATSMWMAIDLKRAFPARLTPEIMDPYDPEPDENFPGFAFTRCERLDIPVDARGTFYVTRSMIDVNRHVHNPLYLDMADEILNDEGRYGHVEICYKKEIRQGETVSLEAGTRGGRRDVMIRSRGDGALHAWIEQY